MNIHDRRDRLLDEALEMTFPASDPFTVYMPETGHDRDDDEAAQSLPRGV
jgi:hypothetical protein